MSPGPPVPSPAVTAVLDAVAQAALIGLPNASAVSVTLVDDAGARTAAASSHWADALSTAQYRTGSGPGVDAAVSGETIAMTDATTETRWPAYVAAAMARGALSSVSVPIPIDDGGLVGSLNAFAVGAYGFADPDVRELTRLAGTAAAALTTAHRPSDVGMARALLDQAKGILMARDGGSAAAAVDSLRRTADASGESLRDVAGGLVRGVAAT